MLVTGARGFAKEIAEIICQCNGDESIAFYDDVNRETPDYLFDKYPVLRNAEAARQYLTGTDNRFVLGLGTPVLRYRMAEKFKQLGGKLTAVISPYARIGRFDNILGDGINIMNSVVIEADNIIGAGCLLHNACFISHDVQVGFFCEISPSVNLLGNVEIGNFCSIGTGATILPKIKVGNNVIVGAGAIVTKDVPDNCLLIGVPATVVKKLEPLSL